MPDPKKWDSWKDYHAPEKSEEFEYNPAASEITEQNSAFPETSDFEPPEKM